MPPSALSATSTPMAGLNATNEEIAAMGGWPEEVVETARQELMRLDPVGCGARNVRECLLVQIEVLGENDRLAATLIQNHLPDLQQHKLPHLAKQIGTDVDTLLAELEFIRTLDPYPGRRYSSEEPVLISPEIYIEKLDPDDEDYVIYFSDDGSPRLRVSQQYQQMLGKTDVSNETKSFIREKMRSAVDLYATSSIAGRQFIKSWSRWSTVRKIFLITACSTSSP